MRHPIVLGNWKLHGNRRKIKEFVTLLRKELFDLSGCTVVIAPPEVYLDITKRAIKNSHFFLGAQNVDVHLSGAFTGETSAKMLKDVGVKYVIIGHSERRSYHHESNESIAEKFVILKRQGLIPILCIGETELEKNMGKTIDVCLHQIDLILNTQGVEVFLEAIIAYEPIWAIGTGKSADPDRVQKIHKIIRNHIAKYDEKVANQIIIQYGGSVNSSNAKEFFIQPDIDGALIGSASLQANIFSEIIKIAAKAKQF